MRQDLLTQLRFLQYTTIQKFFIAQLQMLKTILSLPNLRINNALTPYRIPHLQAAISVMWNSNRTVKINPSNHSTTLLLRKTTIDSLEMDSFIKLHKKWTSRRRTLLPFWWSDENVQQTQIYTNIHWKQTIDIRVFLKYSHELKKILYQRVYIKIYIHWK